MKQNFKYFAAALALCATVTSCETSDMPTIPNEVVAGSPISVEVGVVSRAIENTAAELSANGFYLYVDQDGDAATVNGEGDKLVFMKREAEKWVAYQSDGATVATNFNWVNFKEATVTALYAMNSDGSVAAITPDNMSEMVCAVPADQSADNVALYADWLVASSLREGTASLNEQTGKITLNFEHLYSRIAIAVKEDGETQRGAVSVSLSNVVTSAMLNLNSSANTLAPIADAAEGVTLFYDADATMYQGIVLPSSYEKGIEVAINTVGAIKVFATITDLDEGTDGGQTELVSGQDYLISVPVSAKFFVE